MPLAESKITSQGQISVPAEIRRKLGVGPGSTIAWEEDGDKIVVRRAKKYTFEDIHKAGFPEGPPKGPAPTIKQMKEAIGRGISEKYARSRH